MQDPNVVIKVTTDGIESAEKKMAGLGAVIQKLTVNANGTVTASGKLASTLDTQSNSTDKAAAATDRAANAQKNWFAHITRTTIQSAIVNKAFLSIVDAMGQAVKQADLISNFPASMGALGLSTTEAAQAFDKLRTYVQSVGGDLTKAATTVARFAGVTRNTKAAVAEFAGVNNALIAGGAAADVQASALEQLTQAYSRGAPQAIEWKSLMVAMAPQLEQVAKAMGYVNASALGEALTTGKRSMQDFMTELTKMGTGTGPIAQQAIARMQGIEFAANVMKNALTNGLTQIYLAVGRQNIIAFFNFLTDVITVLAQGIVFLINAFRSLFGFLTGQKLEPITGDVAGNMGDAAGAANDIGSGLDDATDSAKKLKNQLASFDKMNVLQDPTDGKDKKPNTGGGGLDPATAATLGSVFGDIGGKMKEASIWAKIFAGILAGLATNQFVNKLFGVNPLKSLISNLGDAAKGAFSLNKNLDDAAKSAENTATKTGGSWGTKFGAALNKNGGAAISGFVGGLASSIAGAFTGIGPAISGALAAGAAALGVSVGVFVLIIAVAVGAIIAVIYTIWDNWDKITKWMGEAWKWFTDLLGAIMKPALDELKKAWDGLKKTLKPVIDALKKAFDEIAVAIKPFIDPIVKFYNEHIKPIIDAIVKWVQENVNLGNALKAIGIIITVVVLAPLALLVAAIALVVVAFVAIITAIVWVIAKIVEFANYFISGKLYDDIAKAVSDAANFIGQKFSEAWQTVLDMFAAAGQWIYTNVIKPIGDFFTGLWNGITTGLQNAWNWMVALFITVAVWIYQNVTKPILDFFSGLWNGIVGIFQGIGKWFGDIFSDAWNGIVNAFNAVGGFFRGVWDTIVSIFGSIGSSIGDAIGGAFKTVVNSIIGFAENTVNGFIRAINGAIGLINKIPGVNIGMVNELRIPRMATGGVVTQPTAALIGEAGAEAVMPLENNTEWIDKLASKINTSPNGGNNPDIIPVTNKTNQPTNHIEINVSGVFATSDQEKKKVAEMIAKQLESTLRAKGLKGAF